MRDFSKSIRVCNEIIKSDGGYSIHKEGKDIFVTRMGAIFARDFKSISEAKAWVKKQVEYDNKGSGNA